MNESGIIDTVMITDGKIITTKKKYVGYSSKRQNDFCTLYTI